MCAGIEVQIMTEKLRLLYVDDESDIRDIVEIALEDEEDFELRVCPSGAAALEVTQQYRADLLLLDVMMPGMDGPTTFKRLREFPGCETTPAVFVTAKVQTKDVEQFKALGAIGVIAKPFDPMTLAAQVRALWEQRLGP
jgi:CheY-like chemotaxis protein